MINRDLFRKAVGSFATGVCLVAVKPNSAPSFAMTINSFSSLSLDPPLVLWSIQKDSDCYGLISESEKFSINILSKEQMSLANQYATKGGHDLDKDHFFMMNESYPQIVGSLVTFGCDKYEVYPGGDHDIVVGLVKFIINNGDEIEPLIFHKGRYII